MKRLFVIAVVGVAACAPTTTPPPDTRLGTVVVELEGFAARGRGLQATNLTPFGPDWLTLEVAPDGTAYVGGHVQPWRAAGDPSTRDDYGFFASVTASGQVTRHEPPFTQSKLLGEVTLGLTVDGQRPWLARLSADGIGDACQLQVFDGARWKLVRITGQQLADLGASGINRFSFVVWDSGAFMTLVDNVVIRSDGATLSRVELPEGTSFFGPGSAEGVRVLSFEPMAKNAFGETPTTRALSVRMLGLTGGLRDALPQVGEVDASDVPAGQRLSQAGSFERFTFDTGPLTWRVRDGALVRLEGSAPAPFLGRVRHPDRQLRVSDAGTYFATYRGVVQPDELGPLATELDVTCSGCELENPTAACFECEPRRVAVVGSRPAGDGLGLVALLRDRRSATTRYTIKRIGLPISPSWGLEPERGGTFPGEGGPEAPSVRPEAPPRALIVRGEVALFGSALKAGTEVSLVGTPTGATTEQAHQRVTDTDGRFAFGPVRSGEWQLTARAPGFVEEVRSFTDADEGERTVSLTLQPGGVEPAFFDPAASVVGMVQGRLVQRSGTTVWVDGTAVDTDASPTAPIRLTDASVFFMGGCLGTRCRVSRVEVSALTAITRIDEGPTVRSLRTTGPMAWISNAEADLQQQVAWRPFGTTSGFGVGIDVQLVSDGIGCRGYFLWETVGAAPRYNQGCAGSAALRPTSTYTSPVLHHARSTELGGTPVVVGFGSEPCGAGAGFPACEAHWLVAQGTYPGGSLGPAVRAMQFYATTSGVSNVIVLRNTELVRLDVGQVTPVVSSIASGLTLPASWAQGEEPLVIAADTAWVRQADGLWAFPLLSGAATKVVDRAVKVRPYRFGSDGLLVHQAPAGRTDCFMGCEVVQVALATRQVTTLRSGGNGREVLAQVGGKLGLMSDATQTSCAAGMCPTVSWTSVTSRVETVLEQGTLWPSSSQTVLPMGPAWFVTPQGQARQVNPVGLR